MNAGTDDWEAVVDVIHLRQSYAAYVDEIRANQWKLDPNKFGRQLHKFCPSLTRSTRRDGNSHVSTYKLPDLETARAEWTARLGHEIDWSK